MLDLACRFLDIWFGFVYINKYEYVCIYIYIYIYIIGFSGLSVSVFYGC